MWPLFTDRWGDFRERLGLHPCPLHEEQALEPLHKRAGEEGVCSSVPGNGARDTLTAVDPGQLPLVLYLFSALVVDRSPFWPDCVRVCGYIFPTPTPTPTPAPAPAPAPAAAAQPKSSLDPASSPVERQRRNTAQSSGEQSHEVGSKPARASDQPECDTGIDVDSKPRARAANGGSSGLPPSVEAFLSAREGRPIYVGFGSMWTMCTPGYRLAFALRVLLLGARQAGSRCMVHLPSREGAHAEKGGSQGAEMGDGNRLAELDSAMGWVLGEFSASAAQDDLLVSRAGVCFGNDEALRRKVVFYSAWMLIWASLLCHRFSALSPARCACTWTHSSTFDPFVPNGAVSVAFSVPFLYSSHGVGFSY